VQSGHTVGLYLSNDDAVSVGTDIVAQGILHLLQTILQTLDVTLPIHSVSWLPLLLLIPLANRRLRLHLPCASGRVATNVSCAVALADGAIEVVVCRVVTPSVVFRVALKRVTVWQCRGDTPVEVFDCHDF